MAGIRIWTCVRCNLKIYRQTVESCSTYGCTGLALRLLFRKECICRKFCDKCEFPDDGELSAFKGSLLGLFSLFDWLSPRQEANKPCVYLRPLFSTHPLIALAVLPNQYVVLQGFENFIEYSAICVAT